jgi:two-component system, chemotaxis family, protein-glutamate methylesterase/glutaminase
MAGSQTHDVVVMGASAGGIEALSRIASQLPADLPAAVYMVLHVSAGATSALPAILSRRGPLVATHPRSGEATQRGRIYVAPPDHHLVLEPGRVLLSRGPRENRVRPAVDVLFRSAGVVYGPRVIGVILTGYLDDGAAGLLAIKRHGGIAVVQDPDDAQCPGMPSAALEVVQADHLVRLEDAGQLIDRLVRSPVDELPERSSAHTRAEVESSVTGDPGPSQASVQVGAPTAISCPDCGGGLFELKEGSLQRFRCYLGHAYSPDALLDAQRVEVERSLWVALRVLEERASIYQNMAQRASERGGDDRADRFASRAAELRQHAERLRELLR